MQDSAKTVRKLNLLVMSVYLDGGGGGAKELSEKARAKVVSLLKATDFSSLSK